MKHILFATVVFSVTFTTTYAGETVLKRVDERFKSSDTEEVPHFQRHVLPLMGRLGCNGRACHGSFQGQGGFRLSLFGYDFKMDLDALMAKDEERVIPDDPEASLILEKPTMVIPHKGGKRMEPDGWEYNLLLRWVESGAKGVQPDDSQFVKLEVSPKEVTFSKAGETTQVRALAHWADGSVEDVTPICRFQTNDESIATVDESGEITSVAKGDTHIITFYDNGISDTLAMLPVSDKVAAAYPVTETPTEIDRLVVAKLRKLGLVQSGLSGDAEFLRRVRLDITGTLPTPQEVQAFLADSSADKRLAKIDELLQTDEHAAWWATRLCDITGNSENQIGENAFRTESARQWFEWIYDRVKRNVPYDELVAGIVLATSREGDDSYEQFTRKMSAHVRNDDPLPFANRETMPHFWSRRNIRQPAEKALSFAHAFLGVRIQCAQCHKHPFDQWTQDDYNQFTAFFAGITYGQTPESRKHFAEFRKEKNLEGRNNQIRRAVADFARKGETIPWSELYVQRTSNDRAKRNVENAERQIERLEQQIAKAKANGNKAVANQLTRQLERTVQRKKGLASRVLTPKLLGGAEVVDEEFGDPRRALMEWVRQKGNPYFAQAFVNRVWAAYFGVGIIDPPDDQNLANPPSNQPLLDHLTSQFVDRGYDMRWLHREITSSRTYQLTAQSNATNVHDERNFSRAIVRRLPAEVLLDAVYQATAGSKEIAGYAGEVERRAIGVAGNIRQRNGQATYALTLFGKPLREANCDCERSNEASLLQIVYLRNDPEVARLMTRNDGWLSEVGFKGPPRRNRGQSQADLKRIKSITRKLEKLRKSGNQREARKLQRELQALRRRVNPPRRTPATLDDQKRDELVQQAFLRTLSRMPSAAELEKTQKYIADAPDPMRGLQDVLWALVNTKEFMTNH